MPKFFIRLDCMYSTNVEAIDERTALDMAATTDLVDWSNDPEWSVMEVEAMEKPDDVIERCINCNKPINLSIDGYYKNAMDEYYWCEPCSWIPIRPDEPNHPGEDIDDDIVENRRR